MIVRVIQAVDVVPRTYIVPGCAVAFSASSDDEILAAVARHAQADHGLVEIPAQLVGQVQCAIVSV
jgi:predicted small metal-binding protein